MFEITVLTFIGVLVTFVVVAFGYIMWVVFEQEMKLKQRNQKRIEEIIQLEQELQTLRYKYSKATVPLQKDVLKAEYRKIVKVLREPYIEEYLYRRRIPTPPIPPIG